MGENARIFSGDTIRLRCIILDERSTWSPSWLRNNVKIPATAEGEVNISPAQTEHSGNYSCYGVRRTDVGDMFTNKSAPVEMTVTG